MRLAVVALLLVVGSGCGHRTGIAGQAMIITDYGGDLTDADRSVVARGIRAVLGVGMASEDVAIACRQIVVRTTESGHRRVNAYLEHVYHARWLALRVRLREELGRDPTAAEVAEHPEAMFWCPFIVGSVTAIQDGDRGRRRVRLALNQTDGLLPGTEFILYRADQYVVKVQVDGIGDEIWATTVDNTWNTAGARIEPDDLAQNRF